MVLIFAETKSLAGAIVVMVIFSLFVQSAEGSTYGIVSYVDPPSTGSISGIVGAGGNVGAICHLLWILFPSDGIREGFHDYGYCDLRSRNSIYHIKIKCHAQLLWGTDSPDLKNQGGTLSIPEQVLDKAEDGSGNGTPKKALDKNPDRIPEPDY
jgi:NNP family nitrate/nitrite transporter-like MFS transporter